MQLMDPLPPLGETSAGVQGLGVGAGRVGARDLVEEAGRWKAQMAFSGLTWGSKEEAGLS